MCTCSHHYTVIFSIDWNSMLASQYPGCDGSGSVLSLSLYQGYLQICRIWLFAAEKLLIGALWKVYQRLANLPVHNHISFAGEHHDNASCGGHDSVNGWHQPSREREFMQVTAYLISLDIFTLETLHEKKLSLMLFKVKKNICHLKNHLYKFPFMHISFTWSIMWNCY